jgi:hypothetical protein
MSAHTPAPWILEQDTVFIGETRKVQPVLYHGDSEGMANARLIAAAPDLLAVLRFLLADYVAIEGEKLTGSPIPIAMAREAIAKAEGGAK